MHQNEWKKNYNASKISSTEKKVMKKKIWDEYLYAKKKILHSKWQVTVEEVRKKLSQIERTAK